MALTSSREADAAPSDEMPPSGTSAQPHQPHSEAVARLGLAPERAPRVLVAVLSAFVAVPSFFWWIIQTSAVVKDPGGFDFCIYFAAALALRDNPHANVLDLHVIQAAALRHHAPNPVMSYVYPPLLAISLIPLTALSYVDAARMWVGINLALWVLVTCMLAGLLTYAFTGRQTSLRAQVAAISSGGVAHWLRGVLNTWLHPSTVAVFALGVAVFASMSHDPTVKGLQLGQISIVIYFLLLLVPWLVRRRQMELAGAVLALATTIKIFPIVLLGYYLVRGRWRVGVGAAAGFAVLYVVMVRVVEVQGLLATTSIFSVGTQLSLAANNQALAHVPLWIAAELGRQPGPKTLRLGYVLIGGVAALFALGMLVTAWRDLRSRKSPPPDQRAGSPHDLLGYAWAICTMILISPIVWEHYGSWLLPAFACCLGYAAFRLTEPSPAGKGRARAWQATFAVIAVVIGYAVTARLFPFNYDSEAALSPGPYIGHIAIRPLFMVLRPLGTTLVWIALGWLFLWPQIGAGHSRHVERSE
jgi:hypothetical protein